MSARKILLALAKKQDESDPCWCTSVGAVGGWMHAPECNAARDYVKRRAGGHGRRIDSPVGPSDIYFETDTGRDYCRLDLSCYEGSHYFGQLDDGSNLIVDLPLQNSLSVSPQVCAGIATVTFILGVYANHFGWFTP